MRKFLKLYDKSKCNNHKNLESFETSLRLRIIYFIPNNITILKPLLVIILWYDQRKGIR